MGKSKKSSQSKSSSRSISVSAPSRADSVKPAVADSGCHQNKPCAENTCRKIHCDAKVDVDLDVCPKVHIDEVNHRDAAFDIAVEVDHKPTCCIRHIRSEPISDCRSRCIFRVDLGSDYVGRAKIISHPTFGRATFNLAVDAKTKQTTTVRPRHPCEKR